MVSLESLYLLVYLYAKEIYIFIFFFLQVKLLPYYK